MHDNYKTYSYNQKRCNLPKTKNFDCLGRGQGRPDFPFVLKSCKIDRSQGRLV